MPPRKPRTVLQPVWTQPVEKNKESIVAALQWLFFPKQQTGTSRNPTARYLARRQSARHRGLGSTILGDGSVHSDVVSPKLCDDIISYLAPSLEKHKGCTIVDINPGVCLFSSKLHDYLKPKRHVLMEPDDRYLKPFIEPLLQQSDSKYIHTSLSGADPRTHFDDWPRIRDLILYGSSDAQTTSDGNQDHGNRSFDPNTLVIGNLTRRLNSGLSQKRLRSLPQIEFPVYVMNHFAMKALTQQLYHEDGALRMLWWVPDQIKRKAIVSEILGERTRSGVGMDAAADIFEVAGVQPNPLIKESELKTWKEPRRPRIRPGYFDRVAAESVRERMQVAGTKVPEGRKLQPSSWKSTEDDWDVPTASPFTLKVSTIEELRERIEICEARLKDVAGIIPTQERVLKQTTRELFETCEYPQCHAAVMRFRRLQVLQPERTTIAMDFLMRQFNLEVNFAHLSATLPNQSESDRDTFAPLRARIIALEDDFSEIIGTWTGRTEHVLGCVVEAELAFWNPDRPLLSWDRRRYEPLQAEREEFFPDTAPPLALLDMQPTHRDLAVPDLCGPREGTDTMAELLRELFSAKNLPVPTAMDRIAVNAAQDLVPMMPSLNDPRKGGRLNPMRVTIRMMTEAMVEELVKAWMEWPFRPMPWQLGWGTSDRMIDQKKTELTELADDEGEKIAE